MADVFVGSQSLDTIPPSVSNQTPAPDATNVLVGTNIEFDLTDDPGGSGVDQTTIDVTVNGANAIVGGVQQAGFAVTFNVIANGFNIVINPDSALPQDTLIPVVVDADDLAPVPNTMPTVTYSFTTEFGDQTAPTVSAQVPADSATGISCDTAIEFDLLDLFGTQDTFSTGVDTSTITVTVDSQAAITGGVAQTGYSNSTITAVQGGFRVRVVPDASLTAGSTVDVAVDASDLATPVNVMTTVNYSFDVELGDNTAPAVSNRHPAPGATQVPITQPITFDLEDLIGTGSRVQGVNLSSLRVQINGADAILGGVVQGGYTGTVLAKDDGYEVSIAPVGGFALNTAYTVEVDAYDGPLLFLDSFDEGWEDLPPDPQFDPPDTLFGPEDFEASWDDAPNPDPDFSAPDDTFTEQFDASWDGVP